MIHLVRANQCQVKARRRARRMAQQTSIVWRKSSPCSTPLKAAQQSRPPTERKPFAGGLRAVSSSAAFTTARARAPSSGSDGNKTIVSEAGMITCSLPGDAVPFMGERPSAPLTDAWPQSHNAVKQFGDGDVPHVRPAKHLVTSAITNVTRAG